MADRAGALASAGIWVSAILHQVTLLHSRQGFGPRRMKNAFFQRPLSMSLWRRTTVKTRPFRSKYDRDSRTPTFQVFCEGPQPKTTAWAFLPRDRETA